MQKTIFILLLFFSATASAAFVPHCSTDSFGNEVCLDKDGVLTAAPAKAASGVSADESKAGREDMKRQKRCAVDAFGNIVCSQ